MRMLVDACVRRALVVILLMASLAVIRPVAIVAQDAPMRWDGSIERLSSVADFGWPETGPARMSRHAVSEDGRWLVFTIDVPDSPYPGGKQVFKRDRLFGSVQALFTASVAAPPAISADGNHMAVELCDGLWRSDGATICDVVLSHPSGIFNASTALDGTESNAASSEPMLSHDGRFLVFKTMSTTLLPPGATPGQIVVRDRDLDGDGSFDEPGDVAIEVVSLSSGGQAGNAASAAPVVSADGRFVAFRSAASNLVTDDTNEAWDVFLHDRQTGETRRINVGWDGQQATPTVDSPAIAMTPDGNLVAFAGDDGYLSNPPVAEIDNNDALDVLVYDRMAGTLERIDVGVNGTVGNGHTYWPTFSSNGRYVSMLSVATNTEEPSTVTAGRAHVYVYDRVTARVTRVSATPDGSETDAHASNPAISGDGSFAVFSSTATNLSPGSAGFDAIFGAAYLEASPSVINIPARGGDVTLTISAQQYVNWFVELSDNTWLSSPSQPWRTGPGTLTLSALANLDASPRSASVRLGARTISVTQEAGLSLASVSPASGPAAGGTIVTLTGTGFEPDMVVYVDGTPMPVEFVSSTTARIVTPAHDPGPAQVWIQTSDFRYASLMGGFLYLEPASTTVIWTAPEPIVYGTALNEVQLNAIATMDGSFTYEPGPGAVLPAGTHALSVTFTPSDPNYARSTATVVLEVLKATPVVELQGGTFTYDGLEHAATGSVVGVAGASLSPLTLTYNGTADAPVNAGDYGVVASYAGDSNYNAAYATTTVTIVKATPTMWVTGGTFTYDGLSHAATATARGVGGVALAPLTVTYNGSAGVPINAGTYAVLASFDGNDNYNAVSATTSLLIEKASAVVNVSDGTFTYDGAPHAATGAATGAAGQSLGPLSLTYNGFEQPPVNAGTYDVMATFAGDANHHQASATGTLTIEKATPSVVVVGGTFTYNGGPHHAQASAAGVAGEALGPVHVTYNGVADPPVNAGTYAVVATYDGSMDYRSASATATLTIAKATPVITWPQPAAIVYGAALDATQLNATASTAGTFSYSPGAGTVLAAGVAQTLFVQFTPSDTVNYSSTSAVTVLTVTPALLEVRANDATKKFAHPMPEFTATITGFVNGDSAASLSGTLAFATTATTHSLPGTYLIVPSGVSSPNYEVRFVAGTLTVYRGSTATDSSGSDK
jgi:hypothetical protein